MTLTHRNRLIASALVALSSFVSAQSGDVWSSGAGGSSPRAVFVENNGQWPAHVAYAARTGPLTVWFDDDGILLSLEDDAGARDSVRLSFGETARLGKGATYAGVTPRVERRSFLHGDDPSAWVHGAATFESLVVEDLYDGIDLVVRDAGGRVEYDVRLDSGARLDRVSFAVEGADDLRVDTEGTLRMATSVGEIVQRAPVSWHALPSGEREHVASAFRLIDERSFGFVAPTRRAALPLVVDPVFEWSTFLGGNNNDLIFAMDVAEDGGLILAGMTKSSDFPLLGGGFDQTLNGRDGFVTKLSADGTTVQWSTVIGGGGGEEVRDVAVGVDGSIGLAGYTASSNFPRTADAFDMTFDAGTFGGANLNSDAFATRLSADGTTLLASTYLGGTSDDIALCVAMAPNGDIVVGGKTSSTEWPTSEGAAFDTFLGGSVNGGDGFIARVSADGTTLVVGSYVPGSGDELVAGIALDADERIVAAGWTSSAAFPTTEGAHDTVFAGTSDGFVLRMSADGTELVSSTLLGGVGDDAVSGLELDDDDRAVVTGNTHSPDFPTTATAPSPSYNGGGFFFGDGFVSIVSVDGSTVDYSTFLGGSGDDIARAALIDGEGRIVVVGYTYSSDLPVTLDALDTTLDGTSDVMTFIVDPEASVFLYAAYIGGSSSEQGESVVMQPATNLAVIGGATFSSDFPFVGDGPDDTFGGFPGFVSDAFVSAFSLDLIAPAGEIVSDWESIGYGLEGALFEPPELFGLGLMQAGAEGSIKVEAAPGHRAGVLLVGLAEDPMPYKGGTLAFVPLEASVLFTTTPTGETTFGYSWDEDAPIGFEVFVQAWITDPAAPEGYCASNAIHGVMVAPEDVGEP